MAIIRKKKTIDAVDREILRNMYYTNRNMSGNQLAKKLNISGSTIAPRLNNLKSMGIVKPVEVKGMRSFNRSFVGIPKPVRINAPRSILWGLDIKKPKNRR
jgi:DNA-binding Lrp family transcriptional regulator